MQVAGKRMSCLMLRGQPFWEVFGAFSDIGDNFSLRIDLEVFDVTEDFGFLLAAVLIIDPLDFVGGRIAPATVSTSVSCAMAFRSMASDSASFSCIVRANISFAA